MIKMSKELMKWVETVRSLGNQDTELQNLLECVKEILSGVYQSELISEEEFLKLEVEIEDILLDNEFDLGA